MGVTKVADSNIGEIVGNRIRLLRTEKGLSIEELAFRAGVDGSHLGKLERGKRNASLVVIEKIAVALETNFEELFRCILPPNPEKDTTTLSLIINKVATLDIQEQKEVLSILNSLFHLMKKPDK
jgi:transcriptional regulator with XRE-family HTH domain